MSPVDPSHPALPVAAGVQTHRASGRFEVTMQALALHEAAAAHPLLGRRALAKVFSGDLAGSGQGEMLSAGTATAGSAGYVAIEQVQATLHGRRGSFALLHRGVMDRGTPQLSISVVPDSGTGELAGLAGTLALDIRDGVHHYTFDYTLG